MKKVEFRPCDLSKKAFAWYSGCSADVTEENGVYFMDGEKMGSLKDLESAFESFQIEAVKDEIMEMLDSLTGADLMTGKWYVLDNKNPEIHASKENIHDILNRYGLPPVKKKLDMLEQPNEDTWSEFGYASWEDAKSHCQEVIDEWAEIMKDYFSNLLSMEQ